MSSRPLELGARIDGPTALGSDPRRLFHLTWALAATDFRLRYFGSALGYLWQLVRPLLLFGVLYVVFTQVVRLGGDVELYPVALLLGVVLFTFLAEATGGAVSSFVERESLVRKIEFPRLVIPLATVVTALMNLSLNLLAVVAFLLVAGGEVRLSWLAMPLLVAALAAVAGGLAMLLSALYVKYRDLRPIWDVALQILFYASPVFYPIEVVVERNPTLAHLLMLNPFAAILQEARHVFISASHMSAAEAIGGGWRLLAPAAIGIGVIVLGYRVFARRAPRIAEDL